MRKRALRRQPTRRANRHTKTLTILKSKSWWSSKTKSALTKLKRILPTRMKWSRIILRAIPTRLISKNLRKSSISRTSTSVCRPLMVLTRELLTLVLLCTVIIVVPPESLVTRMEVPPRKSIHSTWWSWWTRTSILVTISRVATRRTPSSNSGCPQRFITKLVTLVSKVS